MPKNLLNDCSLFADDAKIYGTSAESLQSDLIALNEWSVKWQLPFNGDKCLYVGNKRNKPSYVMNGKSITEMKEEKDLGILMDDNFKFRKHCPSVVKKSNSSLAIIKRTFANLNEKTVPIDRKTTVGIR